MKSELVSKQLGRVAAHAEGTGMARVRRGGVPVIERRLARTDIAGATKCSHDCGADGAGAARCSRDCGMGDC